MAACLAVACGLAAAGQRAVAVLYDDSDSMRQPSTRWIGANFSLQVLASLLLEGDELWLLKMNAQPRPSLVVVPDGIDPLLRALRSEPRPAGGTPYAGVGVLLEQLRQSSAAEKWLVVVTDGDFSGFSPAQARAQIDQLVKPHGIKVVFVLIESRAAGFAAARLWESEAGAVLIGTAQAGEVPRRMEEVAALLTGRDANGLQLDRAGSELTVSSRFPLRGLVVLAQGDSSATVSAGLAGSRPMRLRGYSVQQRLAENEIPRYANVAHLSVEGGIAAGEKAATIRFATPIERQRITVYPEVAARLETALHAADGSPLKKDAQGYYNVCEGESVTLQSRLVGSDGRPLTVGRTDLGTFEVGYDSAPGAGDRSALAASQEHFTAKFVPTGECRITPYARYAGYFNYQGEVMRLRPRSCRRDIVVRLASPPGPTGLWSARVDRLADAPPLRFSVTIDGKPATEAELSHWTWADDGAQRWMIQPEPGGLVLAPRSGCCVWTWRRPKAHSGRIEFSRWRTGNARDAITAAAVAYEWTLPEGAAPRLWWLYGCPAAALAAAVASLWWTMRLLRKQRFPRRARVYFRTNQRTTDFEPLVRPRSWLVRWLWPSRRESRDVLGYRFVALGGGAVLVSGTTLGEQDEIVGWRFDPNREARRQPQSDVRLVDRASIRHRASRNGPRDRYDKELQYARTGNPPKWPD